MKKLLFGACLALAVLAAGAVAANYVAPRDIDDIMEDAHGGGKESLRAMVLSGKADAAEAKKLLALYEDLAKNKPPKGTEAAWKKKTEAILAAAKKVAAKPNDTVALKALDTATNCMNCHKEHKP